MSSIKNIEGEVWKEIIGYDGRYSVSNYGRVMTHRRLIGTGKGYYTKERLLKPSINCGYYQISLTKGANGKKSQKCHPLHVLVWNHFGDKERENGLHIDHIDNLKTNNHISNLQLLTPQENTRKYIKTIQRKLPLYVYNLKNKYVARPLLKSKPHYLGWFDTIDEAVKKIEEWQKKHTETYCS